MLFLEQIQSYQPSSRNETSVAFDGNIFHLEDPRFFKYLTDFIMFEFLENVIRSPLA